MATRDEAFRFIKETYTHEIIGDFTLKLKVPIDLGRTQMVYAHVSEAELQVTSPFAWQSKITADDALELNTSMFGIVKINGAFALKHNAFIEDIDESEIDKAFLILAIHADALEKQVGSGDEF